MKTRYLVSTSAAVALSVASFGLYAGSCGAGGWSAGASPSAMRGHHSAMRPAVYQPPGYQRSMYRPQGYGHNMYRPVGYSPTAGGYEKGGYVKVASHSEEKDIVDVAVSAGSFDTLVTAVKAADLAGTLKGEGPFTVFAPTDEAFAKIPADQLQALLKDKDALTAVLTYHVGRHYLAGNDGVG